MSGHYQAALYLGDVSERVRILKNCGQSECHQVSHHMSALIFSICTQQSCIISVKLMKMLKMTYLTMLKKQRKTILGGLGWDGVYSGLKPIHHSKFGGNLCSSFCVILPTNQPNNKQT